MDQTSCRSKVMSTCTPDYFKRVVNIKKSGDIEHVLLTYPSITDGHCQISTKKILKAK